ncbi:MAG: hypothetical protein QM661_01365 [Solimonas sp.]
MSNEASIKATAGQIVELDKEVEATGHAAVDAPSVLRARKVLEEWARDIKGVVVSPAVGRVTLIHENGRTSSIASAELAFRLSAAGLA